jgi:hypothetical protein
MRNQLGAKPQDWKLASAQSASLVIFAAYEYGSARDVRLVEISVGENKLDCPREERTTGQGT